MYNGNFNSLLKIIESLIVDRALKTSFCELCTLKKQYKVHSKEPFNYRTTNSGEK